MTRWFIGLDLAWGERNGSGVARGRLVDGRLRIEATDVLRTVDEIAAWIRTCPGDWVIGIDAPIVVRNREGSRPADRAITRAYGRFEAGAHATNLRLLRERVRAAEVVRALAPQGLRVLGEAPRVRFTGRWAFETYPHAGMVELFGLPKTIKYKKGRVDQRRRGQRQLADLFEAWLPRLDPPVTIAGPLRALLAVAPGSLRGRALKEREDQLDAVFCACVAAHLWRGGARSTRLLGDAETGAVLLPAVRKDVLVAGAPGRDRERVRMHARDRDHETAHHEVPGRSPSPPVVGALGQVWEGMGLPPDCQRCPSGR